MAGAEIVLSILAAVVTALVGIIISLVLKSQAKFETRMEKHTHDLRSDIQALNNQLIVLRTVVVVQMPLEEQQKFQHLFHGET